MCVESECKRGFSLSIWCRERWWTGMYVNWVFCFLWNVIWTPPPQPMKSTKLILRTKNKAVLIFESFDEFIKCVYSKKKSCWTKFYGVAPQLLTTSNFIGPWYHAALLFSGLGSIVLLFGVLFSQQIREDLVRAATSPILCRTCIYYAVQGASTENCQGSVFNLPKL